MRIAGWQAEVGRDVLVDLRGGIDDLRRRVNQLREPQPLRVLGNPDFEVSSQGDLLPGWDSSRGADISAEIVAGQGRGASHALRLRSAGPWPGSAAIPSHRDDGPLSVWVWLRIDDPSKQPPLQLAIEGRLDGQTYYRPARVGAGDDRLGPPPPLKTDWELFLVRIDDLPTRGLTDLRVAIDLMGAGEVWADDVQVVDLWFDKTERKRTVEEDRAGELLLGKGEVAQCEQVLRGYWPEFFCGGTSRSTRRPWQRSPMPSEPDSKAGPLRRRMIPRRRRPG